VARLHILKRRGEYLASENFADLSDSIAVARCKAVLERADEVFVTSSRLQQKGLQGIEKRGGAAKARELCAFRSIVEK
jgi:hypothetical protein